ncbi:MAG: hypothetical protein ACI93R_000744 [Flavobacteriales bacterium]|jgi:hypothetical protein
MPLVKTELVMGIMKTVFKPAMSEVWVQAAVVPQESTSGK